MCLCVEHILVKTDQIGRRKDQVEIFQRFGLPEALKEVSAWYTTRLRQLFGTYLHRVALSRLVR